jgi:hypothetical protein
VIGHHQEVVTSTRMSPLIERSKINKFLMSLLQRLNPLGGSGEGDTKGEGSGPDRTLRRVVCEWEGCVSTGRYRIVIDVKIDTHGCILGQDVVNL